MFLSEFTATSGARPLCGPARRTRMREGPDSLATLLVDLSHLASVLILQLMRTVSTVC